MNEDVLFLSQCVCFLKDTFKPKCKGENKRQREEDDGTPLPPALSLSLSLHCESASFPPFTVSLSLQLGHQPSVRLSARDREEERDRKVGCVACSGIRSQM